VQKRYSKKSRKTQQAKTEPKEPYGFLLTLKALKHHAISLRNYPAAVRMLVTLAGYMNQDGVCHVRQDTLAAELDISRQAAHKLLWRLVDCDIINFESRGDGTILTYSLNRDEVSISESYSKQKVDRRKAAKKAAKRGKFDPEKVKPRPKPPEPEPVVVFRPKPPPEPIEIGDTVQHHRLGIGKVEPNGSYGGGEGQVLVQFQHSLTYVPAASLTKCAAR
jgi:hypothetical protein